MKVVNVHKTIYVFNTITSTAIDGKMQFNNKKLIYGILQTGWHLCFNIHVHNVTIDMTTDLIIMYYIKISNLLLYWKKIQKEQI